MKTFANNSLLTSMTVVVALVVDAFHPETAHAETLDKYLQWQHDLIFNPTASQLRREQRGGIFIFDGLKDKTVELAMDTQFDRIDSMMFVGTIVTDNRGEPLTDAQSGEPQVEDDGC